MFPTSEHLTKLIFHGSSVYPVQSYQGFRGNIVGATWSENIKISPWVNGLLFPTISHRRRQLLKLVFRPYTRWTSKLLFDSLNVSSLKWSSNSSYLRSFLRARLNQARVGSTQSVIWIDYRPLLICRLKATGSPLVHLSRPIQFAGRMVFRRSIAGNKRTPAVTNPNAKAACLEEVAAKGAGASCFFIKLPGGRDSTVYININPQSANRYTHLHVVQVVERKTWKYESVVVISCFSF